MMGSLVLGGQRITVSGPCGSDGLPEDIGKLTPKARSLVVEVPADIAIVYWSDGGHNEIGGSAAAALRTWALSDLDRF